MRTFDDTAYRNKPGYIYLIHAEGTSRYKIGLTTRSVEQRLAELNSSQSPYPLRLIDVIETEDVTETEGYLHQKFSHYRKHGEWFEFNQRQLKEVMKEYDRLHYGDKGWFKFPTLATITLPSLPSLRMMGSMQVDANVKGLLIAGIGAAWLLMIFAGCLPQSPNPSQRQTTTQLNQRL